MVYVGRLFFAVYKRRKQRRGCVVPLLQSRRFARRNASINVSKDWSREPCGTCTGYGNIEAWRQLTKYLQISPFMYNAPETFAEYPELWDIAYTMYTNTLNYG